MPDLLFELRCEELPARAVPRAAENLRAALASELAAAGLAVADGAVRVLWTPRRITLTAAGLPGATPLREDRVKGPRLSAAFDASGAPTKAAEGFAKKNGVEPSALVKDGDFVVAVVRSGGRPTAELLATILPGLPPKAGWAKTMRWGAPQPFARPVRGVVALFGADVVPCSMFGLAAGRTTAGHPFLSPESFDVASADPAAYVAELRKRHVLADPHERARAVSVAAKNAAPEAEIPHELLEEVTNLVEWPAALLGRFDARFLELPPRLLTTVMAHHQRFFPVRGANDRLKNEFVAILDRTDDSSQYARRGFERVLVPRLHDAMFFLGEDRKKRLEERLERLKTVTYHKKLGTTSDKAKRLEHLAKSIAAALGGSADEQRMAARAGLLAKCDLATFLVGEFPELQGHVGSVYAAREGEPAEVAEALDLQYVHDFDGRPAPSRVALALLLAENLDIVAQFGTNVGLPSGNADPFGVRRAAITLLDACERWAPAFDLRGAASSAAAVKPVVPATGVERADATDAAAVLGYLDTRLRQRFKDRGVPADHLDAIESWTTIGAFASRIEDLRVLSASADFARLLEVAQRCRNITKTAAVEPGAVDPAHFRLPAEGALSDAWTKVRGAVRAFGSATRDDIAAAAAALAQPLHTFFADVLVNDPDPAVRTNRLRLLLEIDRSLREWADLCKIVSRGA